MATISAFKRRYLRRVIRDVPVDLEDDGLIDLLGVLRTRVLKTLEQAPGAEKRTPAHRRPASFSVPGSPPWSRRQSAARERSFHLALNKPGGRTAQSFDRYASRKGTNERIAAEPNAGIGSPDLNHEEARAATAYDAYAAGHGGGEGVGPDHLTTLSTEAAIRRSQWDTVEAHERAQRVNAEAGPPRIAIFYSRAPELFDRAASLSGCPAGLKMVIEKERRRAEAGRQRTGRPTERGVPWIDDGAPAAQRWLEGLPGWDSTTDKERRLSRVSLGRAAQTHIAGEIEYPALLKNHPNARARIRAGLAAHLDGLRNPGDDLEDGSILPLAIYDHLPDRLNDRRNVHCHLVAGTRRAWVGEHGSLTLAERKVHPITRQGFIEGLRARFADLANAELDRLGADYRLNPGTDAEMGIKGGERQRKLHGRAVALERAGVPTALGVSNDIEGWRRMVDAADARDRGRRERIDRTPLVDAARALRLRAASLRHEAEQIALLIAMSNSRAKRTSHYAPHYAARAANPRDQEGWLTRQDEARAHLATLHREVAPERAAIKDKRLAALRLDREAAAMPTPEQLRHHAEAERTAAHRAVDLIARTPLLIGNRDGVFGVARADDPSDLVGDVDLADGGIQRRLAGQHAAQQKALAQVRAFAGKHGHAALFDEERIGRSAWLRAAIEQWRSSPVIAREERERASRAAAHRRSLVERHRRYERQADPLENRIARGAITLAAEEVSVAVADMPQAEPQPAAAAPTPVVSPIPVKQGWRPTIRPADIADVGRRWQAEGQALFAADVAGFDYLLPCRPDTRSGDPVLADALGGAASWLNDPGVQARLAAAWLYQEATRCDLLATRTRKIDVPTRPKASDPAPCMMSADLASQRERHGCDARLLAMIEDEEAGRSPPGLYWPTNRLLRVALQAVRQSEPPAVCRVLADAALGQAGGLAIRRALLTEAEDRALFAASSLPSKGIYKLPLHRNGKWRGGLPTTPGPTLR